MTVQEISNSINPFQRNESTLKPENIEFQKLIQRLEPIQKKALFAQLDKLDSTILVHKVVHILNTGEFTDPFFMSNEFDLYALQACRMGVISAFQFGDLMILKTALPSFEYWKDVRRIPLFSGESINSEAWNLISYTAKTPRPENSKFNYPDILSEQQIAHFFEQMRSAQQDEQHFFLVPRQLGDENSLGTGIYERGRYNFFGRLSQQEVGGEHTHLDETYAFYIVASQKMLQSARQVRYGKNAIKTNPVIGTSTSHDFLSSQLVGERDKAIPMHNLPYPGQADSYIARYDEFGNHDNVHHATASAIPEEHRLLLLSLGKDINNYMKNLEDTFEKKLFHCAFDGIVDLDAPDYRIELKPVSQKNDNGENFWRFLRLVPLFVVSILNEEHVHFKISDIATQLESAGVYKFIADYLSKHKVELENNGITVEKLRNLYKKLSPDRDNSLIIYLIRHLN